MWKKIKPYILPMIVAIILPVTVGTLSAILTRESMAVYSNINKPTLSPPAILFPIVWTVLYILMGVSSGIVYIKRESASEPASAGLRTYLSSLVFNFLWSIIFFNVRSPIAALVTLLILLYLIIRTVIHYWRVSPTAAILQLPYALWVTFAGYLNAGIYFLN